MKDEMAREKAIEKLVARRLRQQGADRGANCLEAETLAAYVERTLTPGEKVSCEAHLSSCLHCQEQVAQLVRASEGEVEVGPARAPLPARAVFTGFRWTWAAPALVAVLVAGLWYTREFRPLLRMRQETPASTVPASAPAPLPSPVGEGTGGGVRPPVEKVEHREKEARVSRPEAKASASASARPGPAGAPAAGQGGGVGKGAGEGVASAGAIATPSERARLAGTGLPAARADESAAAGERRDMAPPPIPALRRQETQGPRAEAPAAQPANAPERPKEQEQAADRLAREEALGMASKAGRAKHAALSAALNSSVSVAGTWRVGPRGLIEKLGPQGEWAAVESGVKADLFAIAFPMRAVGWAVGAGGTVLRTTDGGMTWNKLAFPTTDDLVRVSAGSDEVAWVWTRAGQSFLTSNRGKSWKRVH